MLKYLQTTHRVYTVRVILFSLGFYLSYVEEKNSVSVNKSLINRNKDHQVTGSGDVSLCFRAPKTKIYGGTYVGKVVVEPSQEK